MAPKPKFRKVVINYPPLTFHKWKQPLKDRPHVPTPFKRKPMKLKPIYPQTLKVPHSTLAKIWHKYKVCAKNIAILMGNFSQFDGRYPPTYRGKQGPANCFVAIGYTKILEMDKWTPNSMDIILTNGYKLYIMSLAINKNTCDCTTPHEVHNNFFIDGYQVILLLDEGVKHGRLYYTEGEPYFKNELQKVFQATNYCIVEVDGKFFAIWKLKGSYYLFDPNDRDELGNRVRAGEGRAVIMKFVDYFRLVNHIQTTLSPTKDNKAYTITLIQIKQFTKVDFKPPDTMDSIFESKKPKEVPPKSCLASKLPPPISPLWKLLPDVPEPVYESHKKGKKKEEKKEEIPEIDYTAQYLVPFDDLLDLDLAVKTPYVIPRVKPKPPPVSYYAPLKGTSSGILIGSCHQTNEQCTKFEGKQSLGNAIAAITMLEYFKSKLWYSRMIDEILLTGECIYIDSKQNFIGDQELNLRNVVKKFTMNKNCFTHSIDEATIVGQLGTDKINMLDLYGALKEFFSDYSTGILRGPITLAIWREEGRYYMFDPNERDKKGKKLETDPLTTETQEPGAACVTWFKRLDDLVDLYINNLPSHLKKEYFYVSKIHIENYAEIPEPWNHFKPLKPGKWILSGTISQNNTRFTQVSRNVQCTCVQVLAIIVSKITPVSQWDRALVDDIVIEGDKYFNETLTDLKAKETYLQKFLLLTEVNRKFVYHNKILNITVEECLVNGVLTITDTKGVAPNVKEGLEIYFKDYDRGILTCRGLSFAVWKEDDHYFYFDSHPRDSMGYTHPGGTSCVVRHKDLNQMVQVILTNLKPQGQDYFNIGRITATVWEKTEGFVKPDFFQYLELTPKKGIIRATFHQGDDKHDIRADRQTTANLLAAFAMHSVIPCHMWTPIILDQILTVGDKLYDDSRKEIILKDLEKFRDWESETTQPDLYTINTENVLKAMKIGLNNVTFTVVTPPKEGIFEPFKVKRDRHGNVIYQENELQNVLWNALDNKEVPKNSNHELILESEHISLAIWKHLDLYYVFDPKGKDTEGNWYGRDLWSAKIIIMDENYGDMGEGEGDMYYINQGGASLVTSKKSLKTEVEDGEEEEEEEDFFDMGKITDIDITDAKACVLMFATFDELYKHILENVRPNKRTDALKIYQVNVTNEVIVKPVKSYYNKEEGNWYNFEEIELDKKWILSGNINLNNEIFPEENRGKQTVPMCVAACVFCRLFALPKFTHETINDILKYGDKLYTVVKRKREEEMKSTQDETGLTDDEIKTLATAKTVKVSDTVTDFLIGDYNVHLIMKESLLEGDTFLVDKAEIEAEKAAAVAAAAEAKEKKEEVKEEDAGGGEPGVKRSRRRLGAVRSRIGMSVIDFTPVDLSKPAAPAGEKTIEEPKLATLKKGLQFYFDRKTFALLTAKGKYFALFKGGGYFFLFTPENRGPSGLKDRYGSACIMRLASLDIMIDVIQKSFPRDGSNIYKIDSITIQATRAFRAALDLPLMQPPREPLVPKAFHEIPRDKLILRGNFHQNNPRFNIPLHAASACNGVVSIAMSDIHEPERWTRLIIDDIIVNALRLYKESRYTLGYSFNEWEDKMKVELVNKDFSIGVMAVNWNVINEGIQRGILCIKDPDIPNLHRSVEEFFLDYNKGILESPSLTVAIWLLKGIYYMFDPNSRGLSGIYSTGGTACLILFKNIRDLVEHYLSNVPSEMRHDVFTISPIEMTIRELPPKKEVAMKKSEILKVKEIDSLVGYVDSKKEIVKKSKKSSSPKPDPILCDKHDKTFEQKKRVSTSKKNKSTKVPCCCPERNKLVVRKKKFEVDEKVFNMEEKKKWVRDKSEQRKLRESRFKEHRLRSMLYTLDNGDAIVRAHYSQNSSKFSPLSRNKQTYANALIAIVMFKLHEPKTWSYKNIEIILESGDVLYKNSYMKYRPKNVLLGLRNLLRTFFIYHLKITTTVFKPFIFGDCHFEDLYVGILNFFMQETAGILVTENDHLVVAIFQKTGQYYMFDPHDRDSLGNATNESGCACLMRFDYIENLVEKYLANADISEEPESVPRFSICAVAIEGVERITK